MILQALSEYYARKPVSPRGWFQGQIDFVIVLNHNGGFAHLECEQTITDGKKHPHRCLLPYIGNQARKHANSGKDANLLWDNATFVLGLGKKGSTKLISFRATIEQRLGSLNDPGIKAVLKFLSDGQRNSAAFSPIVEHPEYGGEIKKGRAFLTFQLLGDSCRFVFLRPVIHEHLRLAIESSDQSGTCLVTGSERQPIELCHPVIKNLYGAKKDPNLVSFNQPSFLSFGKEQSANAPVSKSAAFSYTTALNHLTSRDSRQKLRVGDCTAVFWSAKQTQLETWIPDFFAEPPEDDPDRGVAAVESLFKAMRTGAFSLDGTTRFYVLGLTPNAARVAVRFWIADTVEGMSRAIGRHFTDTELQVPEREKQKWSRRLPLNALLAATAVEAKYDSKKPTSIRFRKRYYDVKPNLEGDTMRAILEGLPYPRVLLQSVMQRIRATGQITYPQGALIKAYLNRSRRFSKDQEEEISVTLDLTNHNVGYRLGRLFAALERIQIRKFTQRGGKGPNSTIRDRYYGSASGTPVAVFGTLIRLSKHHLASLDNVGERIKFEKLVGEIIDGIGDFPSYLRLEDQGRFAIGYYHQMQEFFDIGSAKGSAG